MPIDWHGRYTPRPQYDHGRPIATLALAPFAGLLLTMTLVFAALRPPVTHALMVDLPAPVSPAPGALSPPTNRLIVTAKGGMLWNAQPVTEGQLRLILAAIHEATPQPPLQFSPDPSASYESALAAMEIVREAGLVDGCFRFSDLPRYAEYDASPDFAAPTAPYETSCTFWYQ